MAIATLGLRAGAGPALAADAAAKGKEAVSRAYIVQMADVPVSAYGGDRKLYNCG